MTLIVFRGEGGERRGILSNGHGLIIRTLQFSSTDDCSRPVKEDFPRLLHMFVDEETVTLSQFNELLNHVVVFGVAF